MTDHHDHPHGDGFPPPGGDIDVATAADLADDGVLLLDVREQDEWDAGHAPTAVHLPLSRFDVAQLPEGRILAICRSGHRSGHVADALAPAGFDVVNVAGGMIAWAQAGLPMETSGHHDGDAPTVL